MEIDEYRQMAEVETSHWWYQATNTLLQQMMNPLLTEGGKFLDVGCGTGSVGGFLTQHGEVVGADFEPLALKLYRDGHPEVMLSCADANKLPFADNSFDALLCVTVLCHQSIPDPSAVVAECARVTKPGGLIALWEPGVKRLRRAHDRVTHSARRFSVADLKKTMTDNDIDVIRATGAHSYLVAPAFAKSLVEKGESESDLGKHQSGLGGILPRLASVERRWLRNYNLPFGLSVTAIGRKPL